MSREAKGSGLDWQAPPLMTTTMPSRSSAKKGRYDLDNSIGYLLNRAASLIAARFNDHLKVHGVSLQAWRMLATLSQHERQSLSELADHTSAELSYLSRSAAQLEERGLVAREQSTLDKRTSLLSLTEAGWTLVHELAPKRRAIERESMRDVPENDLAITLQTLKAIGNNLVPQSDAPGAVNRKLVVARRVKQNALSQDDESTS
jgi:DNA-binding MarR family transcriptional regulator